MNFRGCSIYDHYKVVSQLRSSAEKQFPIIRGLCSEPTTSQPVVRCTSTYASQVKQLANTRPWHEHSSNITQH